MRRGLLILAMMFFVSVSGQDAQAKLFFGTQDRVNHMLDVSMEGPKGEALYLGYLTSMHAFMLPYSVSMRGYVLGIKGVSGEYYELPKEKIEAMQAIGMLPKHLPVYRRSTFDYLVGYCLWPILLIILVAGVISSRKREEHSYGEIRRA